MKQQTEQQLFLQKSYPHLHITIRFHEHKIGDDIPQTGARSTELAVKNNTLISHRHATDNITKSQHNVTLNRVVER